MSDEQITITNSISQVVKNSVSTYLDSMTGDKIVNLYNLVLEQVEEALLDTVMPHFKSNQVRSAEALGLSRGTLRKKLKQYFGDKYCNEK